MLVNPQKNSSSSSQENQRSYKLSDQKSQFQKNTNEKKRGILQQKLEGSWTTEQNLNFAVFIDLHSVIFTSVQKRKTSKIYTYMAHFMKFRSAQQCRSHFQKIILKYQNIYAFIAKMKKTYGEIAFNQVRYQCPIAQEALLSVGERVGPNTGYIEKQFNTIGVQTDNHVVLNIKEYEDLIENLRVKTLENQTLRASSHCYYMYSPMFF